MQPFGIPKENFSPEIAGKEVSIVNQSNQKPVTINCYFALILVFFETLVDIVLRAFLSRLFVRLTEALSFYLFIETH